VRVAAVALLWIAAGMRFTTFRRGPNFINGSYALAALAVATGLTLTVVDDHLNSWAGPNVSDLLEHGAVVVGGVAAQLFLLALKTGRPSRKQTSTRVAIASVVLTVMAVAFASAPVHEVGDAGEWHADTAAVVSYGLAFHGYLIYVLADNVRLCMRFATAPGDPDRTLGLVLVGWGSAVCLGYPLSRVAGLLVEQADWPGAGVLRSSGSLASIVGLCCLAGGVLAPRVLGSARRWHEARRGVRRLAPLWQDLTAAFPSVALPTTAPVTVRRAELLYDRHLLEIADALALARVDARDARLAGRCIDRAADVLLHSRESWVEGDGVAAAELLPPAATADEERSHLLALAASYRRLRAASRALRAERTGA
jgi:hypothetical protein